MKKFVYEAIIATEIYAENEEEALEKYNNLTKAEVAENGKWVADDLVEQSEVEDNGD